MAATSDETRVVRLRLICLTPPPQQYENSPAEFGLQDKQQVVHPGEMQAGGSLHYEFEVQVRRNRQTNALRFLGPYVHGPPAEPFLYLSWRRKEAGPPSWIRRLKIPLSSITWAQIEAAGRTDRGVLEASVDGTGSGTVPLLGGGWTLRESGSS